MFPDVARYPPRGKAVENHCFEVMLIPYFDHYCSLVPKLLKIVCFLASHQTCRFGLKLLSESMRPKTMFSPLQALLYADVQIPADKRNFSSLITKKVPILGGLILKVFLLPTNAFWDWTRQVGDWTLVWTSGPLKKHLCICTIFSGSPESAYVIHSQILKIHFWLSVKKPISISIVLREIDLWRFNLIMSYGNNLPKSIDKTGVWWTHSHLLNTNYVKQCIVMLGKGHEYTFRW